MKKIVLFGFVSCFILAACGKQQPTDEETAQPDVTSQEAATESADEGAGTSSAEGAQPELVEESAAEPDETQAGDQPLLLAQQTEPVPAREWKFSEGKQYFRLVPTQPTVGGADKIEVAEVFWYGCPHCFNFEPQLNRWAENLPANVRFIRIPAVWNPLARLHGRLFYTEEVLARNGKLADVKSFHAAVFNEFHRKGNRLTSEDAIQKLFERFGVSGDDFQSTWNSFEVNQKLRVADDLARRYNVTGVPSIVVNGKYRTGASAEVTYPILLDVVDELIERETVR
jgi:protein dithiol oxidoreductase (disulfide-forming)